MSAGLIKHLKNKTDEDPNTAILMSQWNFDEQLVGKSLENVGSYYPHFSSHNESHSQQILVNIERLLGDNINKLTATDTWLILEAAYWHDIGMLFNADEVQEVFQNEQFKEYVESLSNDNTQDLHDFARVWHEDGWNKAFVQFQDPHTGVEKYRQMVAEWYRRGHAKNSNAVVLDPFEKLGINSPRTELLPKRIYRYLGQICWSHGLGFDYVMNELPFRQTGMGTENCHPRFVACLLRLGDLFDIDDNRFCPVMARQVGNMPSFSETHKHKHQAIREFQLDNETVSVTAICSTEMAYIECRRWFEWIREEIQNQMSQWKNIVPSRDFGLLPTINRLDVEMTDSKILLNDKPMKFTLDEKSAIELLQGKNLYENEVNIYRELVQNSIDATYIRAWTEYGDKSPQPKLNKHTNPYSKELRDILENFPISIDFKKIKDETDSDYSIWQFSISDMGTGISLKDLEYMQKIAGSSKNIERKRIINSMPVSLRPSGTFGIGLHSVFLLLEGNEDTHNQVYIKTKSIFDNNSYDIKMTSPISNNQGYCFIDKLDENVIRGYGTTLSVYLRLKRRGARFNNAIMFSPNQEDKLVNEAQNTYDSVDEPIFDYLQIIRKIGKIKNQVVNKTPIHIIINEEFNNYEDSNQFEELTWDSKYDLFFGIYESKSVNFLIDFDYLATNFFKGQSVNSIANYFVLPIYLDFYGFNAKDALQLDRNKWKTDFEQSLLDTGYFKDLQEHLLVNHTKVIRNQLNNDKVLSSIFNMLNIEHSGVLKESWTELSLLNPKKFKLSIDLCNKHSFKDLLQLPNLTIIQVTNEKHSSYLNFDIENSKNTIITTDFNINKFWINKFREQWYSDSGYISKNEKDRVITYNFKKHTKATNNLLTLFCEYFLESNNPRMTLSKSSLQHANLDRFTYLCCSSKAHHNLMGKNNRNISEDCLIMPFVKLTKDELEYIDTYNLDELIDILFKSLKQENPSLTIEVISESYQDIIELVDKKMRKNKEWIKARKRGKEFEPQDILDLQKKYHFK